jgi:competence protein ComFA
VICTKYQAHVLYSKIQKPGKDVFCLGYSADADKLNKFFGFYDMICEPLSQPLPIPKVERLIRGISDRLGLTTSSSDGYSAIINNLMHRAAADEQLNDPAGICTVRRGTTLRSLFTQLMTVSRKSKIKPVEQMRITASMLLSELGENCRAAYSTDQFSVAGISDDEHGGLMGDISIVIGNLSGRCLLMPEIKKLIRDKRLHIHNDIEWVLEVAVNLGLCKRMPSISHMGNGDPRCNRCGAMRKLIKGFCPGCRSTDCWLCLECYQMGEVRSCLELYLIPQISDRSFDSRCSVEKINGAYIKLDFELTKPQSDASDSIRNFVRSDGRQECLVWAVCGAGKTEVVYSAIEEALIRKQKVLFAIPRRDVVIELESRLKHAFPDFNISVLYGGSDKKFDDADIVLSTTHQVIRFYDCFDLVIVDEADAFPFYGSTSLLFCLRRAMKVASKLVYMTATPDKSMRAKVQTGKTALVTIPARHHGKPLPEPELVIGTLFKPGDRQVGSNIDLILPKEASDLICESVLASRAPMFIFAPTIDLVDRYARGLKIAYDGIVIEHCHSKDPLRMEKRRAFKDGKIDILVTTSIMERGITIDNCNVIILNADYEQIFDESALIQMAGRVGRTTAHPGGRILFIGNQINNEMKGALSRIRYMNSEAESKGYLGVHN